MTWKYLIICDGNFFLNADLKNIYIILRLEISHITDIFTVLIIS